MLRHPCYLLSIFLQFVSTFSSANIPQKAEKDLCPAWVQDFLPTNRLCENRTRLTITPIKGFGNKLNGVVQGAVGAYIMNRCLLIDWNYNDMLSFTQESVKKAEFNILKQKQARKKKNFLSFISRRVSWDLKSLLQISTQRSLLWKWALAIGIVCANYSIQ